MIDKERKLVLQSEENLLSSYFSTTGEEKEVYEKALKYIYTYKCDGKSTYVRENSYYKVSELKIRFIKEQITKEREYLKAFKSMNKKNSSTLRGIFGDSIWTIIHEIINMRLRRIKYYRMIAETTNSMLHKEVETLYEEFTGICQLLNDLEDSDNTNTNNSYIYEVSNIDYSNTIKR